MFWEWNVPDSVVVGGGGGVNGINHQISHQMLIDKKKYAYLSPRGGGGGDYLYMT